MEGTLFSSYFLEDGIKKTGDWQRLSDADLEHVFSKVKEVITKFQEREQPDEADTEDGLICPILEILGFHWSRQKTLSRTGRQDVPDFVLFPDKETKEEFDIEFDKHWDKAICILEGKRWRRALDRGDRTDTFDPRVPSNQILRYLSLAEVVSNGKILWGILTNGEVWRLYYHRALSRSEGFIEFNLREIVNQNDKESFNVFYLLFRKDAFIPTEWRPNKTFLELAIEEGKLWEARVSESLKDRIFDEVFPEMAMGFIKNANENISNGLLEKVYNNTLITLYRILFLMYAEDRDLLPVRNERYKIYSLSKIRDEIAELIDSEQVLSETRTVYWDRLKNLFKIISDGDKDLKVPPYNGGLFNPNKHPFLEKFAIPDKFLVPAIDKLSRDYHSKPYRRINYRDLSVRQLGSIYEGLLEFRLKIAEADLSIKQENGIEKYVPTTKQDKIKIRKGTLYLTNDKLERKATGSYYTPDYIVQYIVESTIEPLIQEKLKEFESWKRELENKSKNQLRKILEQFQIRFDPKVYDDSGRIIGEKGVDAFRNALLQIKDPAEAILKIRILDPAMGSGHFLVGAVDFLADRILEILAETSDKQYFGEETYRSPLQSKLETIRRKILDKNKEEGYDIDETKLEDKNLIKRIVLKRCIYGVDLNPLAVELAKVSLWLHTFTIGAPLSFLDHHLKCGDSLIGSDLKNLGKALNGSLFGTHYTGLITAINAIEKIQELTDADISEVEESAKLYEEVERQLEPLKKVLDLYTSEFLLGPKGSFGFLNNHNHKGKNNKRRKPWAWNLMEQYDPLRVVYGKISTSNGEQDLPPEDKDKLEERLRLAQQKRFFHWQIEFPEIWYDDGREKKDGGFDIVMGNPPYGAKLEAEERELFRLTYNLGFTNSAIIFIEKGLSLIKQEGTLSFIVPKSLLFSQKWSHIRQKLVEGLSKLKDVSKAFKEVLLEQVIFIFSKKFTSATYLDETGGIEIDKHTCKKSDTLLVGVDKDEIKIFEKVGNSCILMKGIAHASRGLPLQKYLKPLKENKKLIPLYRGDHIGRYLLKQTQEGVEQSILPKGKTTLLKQPKVMAQNIVAHILYPRDHIKLMATYDLEGKILNLDTVENIWIKNDNFSLPFITAILNSTFVSWYAYRFIFGKAIRTMHFENYHIGKIPIPQIDFTTKDPEKFNQLKEAYEKQEFQTIEQTLKTLLHNSAVLHDFLDYLARRMTEYNKNKYLLELYINGKFQSGTDEMIQVIKLLEKHKDWEDNASESRKKEIAKSFIKDFQSKLSATDRLIDQVVYHLYRLEPEDIKIIEDWKKEKT